MDLLVIAVHWAHLNGSIDLDPYAPSLPRLYFMQKRIQIKETCKPNSLKDRCILNS